MKAVLFIAAIWLAIALTAALVLGLRLLIWRIAKPERYFLHHAARRTGALGPKCIKRLYTQFGKEQATGLLLAEVSERLETLDTRGLVGTTEGFHSRLGEFATLMRNTCAALRDLGLGDEIFPLLRERIYPAYLMQPQKLEKQTVKLEQEPFDTVGKVVSKKVESVDNPALRTFAAILQDL